MEQHTHDPACAVAHGEAPAPTDARTLVAVFHSPVAGFLLHFGAELGYRPVLFEPVPTPGLTSSFPVVSTLDPSLVDGDTDVVVTDHHRDDLGLALQAVLGYPARWVGVIGSPRHTGPHIAALRDLGVPEADIDRVHRPIGLNIGSRTPAEIAVSTLAGLIADRNSRPGGFAF